MISINPFKASILAILSQCMTPGYHQMGRIPFGNAWHGGKWHGVPGKDTGTYEGGTEQ